MIVGAAGLIALLANAPSIIALGADKVFLNVADEQTPAPYIVVSTSIDTDVMLTGDPDLDHASYTIAAWAASALQAETVADAIEVVIDAADNGIAVLNRTSGFDQDNLMDVSVLAADEFG